MKRGNRRKHHMLFKCRLNNKMNPIVFLSSLLKIPTFETLLCLHGYGKTVNLF